jgi:hypothetical protein
MDKEDLEEQNNHNKHSGQQGQFGISSGYEKIWDKLKDDIGIPNIVALFLGAILLIFSPDKGWGYDLPFVGYTLAYRGWLGILCFIYVFISIFAKKRKALLETKIPINMPEEVIPEVKTSKDEVLSSEIEAGLPEAEQKPPETEVIKDEILPIESIKPTIIKSMYVHFPRNRENALVFMTNQLHQCKDHASAMLLLVGFEKLFDGKLFLSPFPQRNAISKSMPTIGEGNSKWAWWYWIGEDKEFQLVVSLCQ